MELKELYRAIDGNYEKAVLRFINDDTLKMFFEKYFASTSFQELEKAMNEDDIKAAFEAAHSLKGLTLSMEFTKMAEPCVLLTEDLRAGVCNAETRKYWENVRNEYLKVKSLWECGRNIS